MSKRHIVLISTLAIGYIVMVTYLTYRHPEQSGALGQALFGVLLVGAAVLGVKVSQGKEHKAGRMLRPLKIIFASFAFCFALWLLGSILALPLVGYRGFELQEAPGFWYLFLGASLLLSPMVAKKIA